MLRDSSRISIESSRPRLKMWRTIWEFPRYEISDEGEVRVKEDADKLPGYVLQRHWEKGSLCVDLYKNNRHYTRRLWKLMERYWPNAEYPQEWKAPKYDPGPSGDGRFKLSDEQRKEIKESDLSVSDLSWSYDVSERHIRRIKYGK